MFDTLKSRRIDKITKTHTENISDYMILINIVNSMDAKKNLTKEEFDAYYEVFKKLSQRKKERSANSLQYQHRAFALANEFERLAGVPYSRICGSATDVLYVYRNTKPQFDEIVKYAVEDFWDAVAHMLRSADERVSCLTVSFFTTVLSTLVQVDQEISENELTKYIVEIVSKNILEMLIDKYNLTGDRIGVYLQYDKDIREMSKQAFDNSETIKQYQDMFARTYLSMANAYDDNVTRIRLLHIIKEVLYE